MKGHALTLTLLGGFLKRAFHGGIRQRDRVKFEKADEKMDGGHAAARHSIEQCGYGRRKEELEDAERVLLKE